MAEVTLQVEAGRYGPLVGSLGMFLSADPGSQVSIEHQLREAREFAAQAADRRADFPAWHITAEAWVDAAGSAIIREAHTWKPDLIVVGFHGRSGISRLVLGSVSERVRHHVSCSVRVSRHHLHSQQRSIHVLVGVDGSDNARAAVNAVVARNWPAGTEARVVGVLDSRTAIAAATTLEGTIPVAIEDECRRCMSNAVHEAAQELAKAGLLTTHQVLAGKPHEVLLAEAEEWAAILYLSGPED